MFERYSEMARRVIHMSRYMAGRVGSPEIETEHLLLGLLREDKALARRFLGTPWAAEAVWRKIAQSKPVREKLSGPRELPLSRTSKHVLAFAAEEADLLSNKHVCTEHLLLGLLREEKCFAEEILHERGVRLASTREDLKRIPHNDSAKEKFVRERGSLPEEVVELRTRIRLIVSRLEDAIANHDFVKARGRIQMKRAGNATSCFCCIENMDSPTGSTIRVRSSMFQDKAQRAAPYKGEDGEDKDKRARASLCFWSQVFMTVGMIATVMPRAEMAADWDLSEGSMTKVPVKSV